MYCVCLSCHLCCGEFVGQFSEQIFDKNAEFTKIRKLEIKFVTASNKCRVYAVYTKLSQEVVHTP